MIQPDHWIRHMALQHRMIEPFEAWQVRKGISYGLSSFGYDIRVADEFRIFTASTGELTVVDPKNLDERALVPFQGDVCIIPPNSFALARTVEYFRIPRNVLTICLGKSTYARCFSGDTRVALLNRKTVALEDMANRALSGERFFGYGVDGNRNIIATELVAPRYIGRDALMEVTLDTGGAIQCTPDHKFVLRDGGMMEAHLLREGVSLMPLYRKHPNGYESVFQPGKGRMHQTHWLADDWNVRHGVYGDIPGTHRHHVDGKRRNNYPTNIERVDASLHIRMHNEERYGIDFDPSLHSARIKSGVDASMMDEYRRRQYRESQRLRAVRFWHDDEYTTRRKALLESRKNVSDETRKAMSDSQRARYNDPDKVEDRGRISRDVWSRDDGSRRRAQAEIARSINLRSEITEERVLWALKEAGSIRGAARLLDCDRSVFRRFSDALDSYKIQSTPNNHRVLSVRDLPGTHDVFCLTAPDCSTFALEAGVFVHNCGVIINVTPFEPEWEGYVTMEISNTTPLPCKIYANEGIAQVLFFAGDEPEISYADRKGKYQAQTGITLPKL